MNGPIRRLALGLFAAMVVLLGAVTWVQAVQADTYRSHPRNARQAIAQAGKERGVIVTADGTVVAESVPTEGDPRRFDRVYPQGPLYAHTVGYTSPIVGDGGLEAAYVEELRSRRDLTLSDIVSAILGRELRPRSLRLTLDHELQQAAWDALGDRAGAVVALDPTTGAVLASVSRPSFEPSALQGPEAAENWNQLVEDPDRPLLARVRQEIYPPGSTFKVVVTAAGLEVDVVDTDTTFPDVAEFQLPGSSATIANFGDGLCADGTEVTLRTAFIRSCNTVFADLAIRVGATDLGMMAEALGFNQEIEYPLEVAVSNFPTEDLEEDEAALGQSGIGERDVRATPLQMAMVAAAVANQGTMMQPYLVDEIFDADGNTTEETQPVEMSQAMSPETAAILTELMERVVTEGTGTAATVPGLRVAGKTGTAQASEGSSYPWFIGFAPVDSPAIAVAVMFEPLPASGDSDTGGRVAAPVAADLIARWLETRS